MENLFDYAPTPDELESLMGVSTLTRAAHEALVLSSDTENGYLARLFLLRGDDAKAAEFLSRIPDEAYRTELTYVDALH